MRQHTSRRQHTARLAAIAVVILTASACGASSGGSTTTGSGGGGDKVSITSPKSGATVKLPFTLKWDSSVPLGAPDTGKDHVHVYIDGKTNDYTVVGGNQFKVKGLSAGEHKVEISLQHADHSPVGPKSAVTVTVTGGGASPSSDDSGGRGGY